MKFGIRREVDFNNIEGRLSELQGVSFYGHCTLANRQRVALRIREELWKKKKSETRLRKYRKR